jgi:hypothetical protein
MDQLDLVVEKLDAVPEPLRALYAEQDGKFRLKVNGVEDPTALKGALDKERRAAREAEKQASQWRALGKTPEEIAQLLAAQAEAEEQKAAKAGEWEKLRSQMNEKHAADLKAKDDAIAKMRSALEKHLIDAQAATAIAAAKGVPELLLPHVQKHVRVVEEDGEYSVRVVDAKGDPRVNGKGDPLTIADLVGEMRQSTVFGRAFEGSGRSGGGMPVANGAGGAGGHDLSNLPPTARLTEARKRGLTARN